MPVSAGAFGAAVAPRVTARDALVRLPAASTTPPAARLALQRGPELAAAAATATGAVAQAQAVAPAAQLHVTVTLAPRDPGALAAYVTAISTPGSPDFRRYLTPAQFRARFGATSTEIGDVREALRARGLAPGPASRGGLSIPVTATATQLEHAFVTSLRRLTFSGRRTAIAATAAPALPASAAGAVQSIVGLDGAPGPAPLLVRPAGRLRRAPLLAAHVVTGGPQPCPAAIAAAPGAGAYTADQIATAYGFSGLYAAGDLGAGITVAVYELEPNAVSDITAYQTCYGIHDAISYVPVDGGAGNGVGSGEAALDIENLIGLAPDANVIVYQGPNSNSGNPGAGPYDTFSDIINQDTAQVVSVSWGECEADLGHSDQRAESTLFEQAAVQGQTIVAASGDSGSEDCFDGSNSTQTQLAVDDPSSQPLVTGVGGTTLSQIGPRPVESVWKTIGGGSQPGAGGGGVSSFWAMPAPQLDAPSFLNIRRPYAAGSACGNTSAWCREVPDVAIDADPNTGYLVDWNVDATAARQPSGWQGIGGTSGGAPVWAALLTLTDADTACAGVRLGDANPALYAAAGGAYAQDFNDITAGNNDLTGTNNGQYSAAPGYDAATGLGTPNGAALAASLCAETLVTTSNPGPQASALHSSAYLQLSAGGGAGETVHFHVSGLPPGMKLDLGGVIDGTARLAGTYDVSVQAYDARSSGAPTTFQWTVGGAPQIANPVRVQRGSGTTLAFDVRTGLLAPPIAALQVTVPKSFSLRLRRGVTVTAIGAAVPERLTVALTGHRTDTITLSTPLSAVHVTLGPPALTRASGRAATAAAGRVSVSLLVAAGAGFNRLTATVP